MLIQNIIFWLERNGDYVFKVGFSAWMLIALVLILRLKVLRSEPLLAAPARSSGFSALIFAAVFLFYNGAAVIALFAVDGFPSQGNGSAAATAPATQVAMTQPDALSVPRGPAGVALNVPTSQPLSQPASQAAATEQGQSAEEEKGVSSVVQTSVLNIAIEVPPFLLVIFLASRMVRGGIDGWGFSLRKIPRGVASGLIAFTCIMPILIGAGAIVGWFIETFEKRAEEVHPTLKALSSPAPGYEQVVLIASAVVAAPLLEEVLFRGLIQTVLIQRRWGFFGDASLNAGYKPTALHRWGAIALTSAVFARAHQLDHFTVLFLLSLALGYVYERTGNLWSNITLHAAFNVFSVMMTKLGGGS